MTEGVINTVVLILGMHRSGTSALARTMNLLGFGIPKTLIKANSTNASGHWESRRIARLNDEILEACELDWSSWRTGGLAYLDSSSRKQFQSKIITTLRSEFEPNSQIVLKDPRISRLAPLYIEAIQSMGAQIYPVICFRNPLEVMESLTKRNQMNAIDAVHLWLRYNLEAEEATRQLKRTFIGYDAFMSDWRSVLSSAQDDLQIDWPIAPNDASRQIDAHLNVDLRHHSYSAADTIHDERTEGWAAAAFNALEVLQNNSEAEQPLAQLARIKSEIDGANAALISLSSLRDQEAKKELGALQTANDYLAEQNAKLVVGRDDQKATLRTLEKKAGALDAELNSTQAELKATQKELRQLKKQHWRLRDELSWQKDILNATHGSTSWRVTAPLRKAKSLLSRRPAAVPSPSAEKKNDVARSRGDDGLRGSRNSIPANLQEQIRVVEASKEFDTAYYMANVPAVQTFAGSPIEHYILHGWYDGQNPSAKFDSNAWLASHPHLREGTDSPFFDYLVSRRKKSLPLETMQNVGRVAVFSAISGDYDAIKDPEFECDDVDYFMFTDQDVPTYSKWSKKDFEFVSFDPTRTARFIKTHPHLYFSDYDWAIWVDANLQINCDPRSLVSDLRRDTQISTWQHPLRSCVYDEAEECIARGKDDESTISSLVEFLKSKDFPKKAGLFETSVFVSRMGDPQVASFLNNWWALIDRFSRRDQLALPLAVLEGDVTMSSLAEAGTCMRTDPRFNYYRHQK